MTDAVPHEVVFSELGLSEPVMQAILAIGYEAPSTIQAQAIPHIVARRDLVGQAQTGTGKTAAFALPLLSRIQTDKRAIQVLVLVPTRELAIQVAEAFQKYAVHITGFHVLPVYGGASFSGQLRQLQRGAHVVVATPGRLCDHLRRGTLKLDQLDCLVIDEADEMLRMGFIEEVEWILEQTDPARQVALFSATMPDAIRRIAMRHLREPVQVTIESKTTTADAIRQRYWMVSGLHKLDALTRILEGEDFDGMIVFVRTKTAAVELAQKLEARGFACAPLNGDIPQTLREQTVDRFRNGDLDILVATDVAARGLDVQRVSHVINYDIPNDTESYIHRIGRTGRAGRTGDAILFVAPRERRLLHSIEKATNQKIDHMQLPTTESINDIRVSRFKQRITDTLAEEELGFYYQLLEEYRQEHNIPDLEIAAALARLLQGDTPLLLDLKEPSAAPVVEDRDSRRPREFERERSRPPAPEWKQPEDFIVTETYRLDVGNVHGVKAGQIIGAIANEAGLEGKYIRNLQIRDDHSLVELPENMPKEILQILKKARVCSRPLRLKLDESPGAGPTRHSLKKKEKFKKKKGAPDHHGGAKKKFKKK